MEYARRVDRLIDRYGQEVEIFTEENPAVCSRAIIQPVRSAEPGLLRTPGGAVDGMRYLYIGKSGTAFPSDRLTTIRTGDASYFVERSEVFRIKGQAVYVRAVLRLCSECAGG